MEHILTSEAVTRGHPDKICDQIADAVLDAVLAEEPEARVACETAVWKDGLCIFGELSARQEPDYETIAREVLRKIGYDRPELGFDWDETLHGTTALAISTTDDVVAPAKILADFAKTHENFNLKAGYLEGKVIGEDEVKKLAAMPSKEVLIAQVLYSFNFPIMQLAIACDAIVKKAEGNEEMKVAELVAPKEAAAEEAAE